MHGSRELRYGVCGVVGLDVFFVNIFQSVIRTSLEKGSLPEFLRNLLPFVIFQGGGGSRPPVSPSGSTHAHTQDLSINCLCAKVSFKNAHAEVSSGARGKSFGLSHPLFP